METTNDLSLERVGPILFARGGGNTEDRLSALLVLPAEEDAPTLRPEGGEPADAQPLVSLYGRTVWRYDFSLPADRSTFYDLGEERFAVTTIGGARSRIAYVSCNGQEDGDMVRDIAERDIMWNRLAAEHERDPFALLLQGGDQLYADDVLKCHEDVVRWAELDPEDCGSVALENDTDEAIRRFYFERYCATFARPAMRTLAAGIPSVMMWDDHDIFDGWGSYPPSLLESPVARGLFAAAREMFLLFQMAAVERELPPISFDASGKTLGVAVRYPNLSVLAPDLRSERGLERVMADAGWEGFEAAMRNTPDGDRMILMSSVPALGPRLSWVEFVADYIPGTQEYEDDLRDQWQSRTHRKEWIRFLTLLAERQEGATGDVTVVSGEIHLATRGQMKLGNGSILHQLVASGISHPPPGGWYPKVLGLLAWVGESPLPHRKARLKPLPGFRTTYAGERNYLVISRNIDAWSAEWELEETGRTAALAI